MTSLAGLVAVLSTGVAFALLLALVAARWHPLQAADVAVVDAVNAAVSPHGWLVTTADVITRLGAPLGVGVVVSVTVVWLLVRRLPRLAAFVAVSGLGAAVLGPGVKTLVDRARPLVEVPVAASGGASFPSGHTIGVTIAWGTLLLVFLPVVPRGRRRLAIAAVAAVVVLVGLTRIALGVHYLSDVVGGWLLGVLWVGATATAFTSARQAELAWPRSPTVDATTRGERRALHPAPAHDAPIPQGWETAAKLLVAAVLITGAVIAAGLLIMDDLASIRRLDAEIVRWFVSLRTETLTVLAVAVGWLGGVTGSITALAIAIPLAAAYTRHWSPSLFLLVAAAGQGAIYLAASRIVGRARPEVEYLDGGLITSFSFPSGHVGASVATYGGIALLVIAWRRSRARYWAIAPAVVVALGVALSRVYRGVHHPTDVIVGALYALVWLAFCWMFLRPRPDR